MFLVKLPFRILSLPVLALLIVIRVASLLVTGISSLVTNLIGMTAVLAAAGFTIGRSSSDMSYPELVHRGSDLVQSHFLILLGGAAAISAAYIAVKWFRRRTTRS